MSHVAKRTRVARRKAVPKSLLYNVKTYGLCNQLFCMACALADGVHRQSSVAFTGFYPNMNSAEQVPIRRLLDVPKTNANLVGTAIVDEPLLDGTELGCITMFPTSPWQKRYQAVCLRALVFADEITIAARRLCPAGQFYCVHFRLDIDCVIYTCCGSDVYHAWLEHTQRGNEAAARRIAHDAVEQHKPWIDEHVTRYAAAVETSCINTALPVMTLTAIGKPGLLLGQNDLIEWAFQQFQQSLAPRRVVRNTNVVSLGREYSAAIELNIACAPTCVGFIGSRGSTFSDTIKLRIDAAKNLMSV
jgi:hypothetical protein